MRAGRVMLFSLLAGFAAACGRKNDAVVDTGNVQGQVLETITFTCNNGGAVIGVHPWHARMAARSDSIKWKLNATNATEVRLAPKGTAQWPFVDDPPTVGGNGAVSRGVKPGLAAGAYPYTITGICKAGAAEDTVILDPDMIIPF